MRITVFSQKAYDRAYLDAANEAYGFELTYLDAPLMPETVRLAKGADAVCVFVNDVVDEQTLQLLAQQGTHLVALRCAGVHNVDLAAAKRLQIAVARVPSYSPHAVAEHTLALVLGLDRNIHLANNRVREGNFALDGLIGGGLYGKTVGVVGTGQIGSTVVRILRGFGCRVLTQDPIPNPECAALGARNVGSAELFASAHIITLHCPLVETTRHMVNEASIAAMRRDVMLINTGRSGLIDLRAALNGLRSGQIGALGLDVYEEDAALAPHDMQDESSQDHALSRLLAFPNVLITRHQGFFTREAMQSIAETTLANIGWYGREGRPLHAAPGPSGSSSGSSPGHGGQGSHHGKGLARHSAQVELA